MAFYTQEADLPWIELPGGFKIVFESISDTTGNTITGVSVSDIAIYGLTIDGETGTADETLGPFMFVPGPEG